MKKSISINQKINSLKKKNIFVEGDKSLSIRFILLSSLSKGRCVAKNLLKSEDVISSINCIKKLGIKIRLEKSYCEVFGKGLNGYKYKRNIILNAGNSGTTARLLCATLIDAKHNIKITGDKSLRKRDMSRIINPLFINKGKCTRQSIGIRTSNKQQLTIRGFHYLLHLFL